RKASHLPSGLQRGCDCVFSPKVRGRFSEPSHFASQRFFGCLSFFRSTVPTTYATVCPSGDRFGSSTSRRAAKSSGLSRRLGAATNDWRTTRRRKRINPLRIIATSNYTRATPEARKRASFQGRRESRKCSIDSDLSDRLP